MRTSSTNSHSPVYLALWSVDGMPMVTYWHPLLCSTNLWSVSHQTPFSLFSCSALYSRGAEPCRLGFPGSRVCRLLLVSTNGRRCGETGGWKAGKFRAFAPPSLSLHSVSVSSYIYFYGFRWRKTGLLWWQFTPIHLGSWALITLPLGFVPLASWLPAVANL